MISIITCSINQTQLANFRTNIESTIGVPYEIIAFDNREFHYGLAKVYNLCAAKAKYDVLCFIHEDVQFDTQNWGIEIEKFIIQDGVGVVGFAGATSKTLTCSGWGSKKEYTRRHYIQHFSDGRADKMYNNPTNESYTNVAVLDGMCLFMTKKVWSENKFDEQTFDRFHLYDLDICMSIGQKYKNYVCNTILLEHFSTGSYNADWVKYTAIFHNKWSAYLPFTVVDQSASEASSNEKFASKVFIKTLIRNKHHDRKYIEEKLVSYYKKRPFNSWKLLLKYLMMSKE